jgi:hypothetical protein
MQFIIIMIWYSPCVRELLYPHLWWYPHVRAWCCHVQRVIKQTDCVEYVSEDLAALLRSRWIQGSERSALHEKRERSMTSRRRWWRWLAVIVLWQRRSGGGGQDGRLGFWEGHIGLEWPWGTPAPPFIGGQASLPLPYRLGEELRLLTSFHNLGGGNPSSTRTLPFPYQTNLGEESYSRTPPSEVADG